MVSTRRPTKAELRRARAEAAKAALARAQRRARSIRIAIWSSAVVVVVVAVIVAAVALNRSGTPETGNAAPSPAATTSAPTAGATGRTTNPPWTAPTDVAADVAAAGLPMLGEEGSALHIHAHLDVYVNGAATQVPSDIGVDDANQKISPLHTHDTTGVIHIESPDKNATFTLGQFFTEWQVALGPDHIGGLTTDATHHLTVYVNGTARTGDPAGIVLAGHDEIALVYGNPPQTGIPNSYQWTNGL
jgi:hypothetical protein